METIPQEKPLRTVSGTSSLGSPTIVRGPLLTAFRSDVTGSASHHAITAPPRRRRLSHSSTPKPATVNERNTSRSSTLPKPLRTGAAAVVTF